MAEVWMVEFTNRYGEKHSEPAKRWFPNTEEGATIFAQIASRWDDARPPRVYLVDK